MGKMERKTKKVKKEGDTCRDCWTKRFCAALYEQWENAQEEATPGNTFSLAEFLNHEHQIREDEIKNMRELFADLYDEMGAIEHLAGDLYMGRFKKEEDQSS